MTGPFRGRIAPGDDSGAVLILALIIITVVSIVVTALLSFTDTSLRTTVQLRQQSVTAAAADGAAQAAINTLRQSTYNNDTKNGQPACFQASDGSYTQNTLTLPNLVPGTTGSTANSAAVVCAPDPDTGAVGGLVPITVANKPGNAILTLSTNPAEDGLSVKALNKSTPFNVHGGIVSNSNIEVTNGTLQSNSTVFAHSGCAGTIVSTPAPVCNAGTVADPNYGPETTTVPAYQAVPASCSSGIATFQPGYYDDAAGLSSLMSNNCVWWFKPGIYYFDFQNSGSHQWVVNDGELLAGTPTDSSGKVLAQPLSPAKMPGACANPIQSTTAVGVQFIFGGDSRLEIGKSADAEICGTYHANRPPIAVYGLKSGTATPTTTTNGAASTVTAGLFTTTPAGTTPAAALGSAGDGKAALWTAAKKNDTATLSMSGFLSGPGIPAGTNLASAKLRIVYGSATAATSRTLTVTPSSSTGPGSASKPSISASAQGANTTQTVDLLSALQGPVHDKGLTDLTVDYGSTMPAGGNEQIDAILLDLTYTVPAFRGETTAAVPGNCLAAAAGSGCALLYTHESYKGNFYIQGTTYAPVAPIDLTLNNITEQVLRFGVISRTLSIKETGSISYIGPVIEIPDNTPGYGPGGTVVRLEVYVCSTPTCSVSTGTKALTARVYIYDPTGTPDSHGKRQMTIQSWSVLRH